MWSYVLAFVLFAAIFGAMDFVWLSNAFRGVYQPAIGPLLADQVRLAPAAIFYLIYVAGVTFFVLAPTIGSADWRQAMLRGAALGLVAYATYDLTNQATMKVWPTKLTLIDLGWGVFATSVAAGLTVVIGHRIAKALGWD